MSFAQEMRDFAAGYKAVADTGRRSAYNRQAADEAKNDPFAGYGGEEEGGNFMDRLKGFFGGDKSDETAITEPEDPREATFGRFNAAYERAYRKGDLAASEKILGNIKRWDSLPSPSGKVKMAVGGAVPEFDDEGLEVTPASYQAIEEEVAPERPAPTQAVATDPLPDAQPEGDAPDRDVVARDMSDLAMPGYAAAYRYAAKELEPAAGIQDDNEIRARRDAYNRGDNAASHDEVKAIDAIIDPDGKLPANAKSAARIAAIWEYYSKRGEEDKAAELINRLSAYDRRNSQTRGVLAQEAMKNGDVEGAVKLIKDAYDQDLPGADLIQPAVLQNGNIKADVIRDGQVVESVEATPDEFSGLIQTVASGQAHSKQALGLISQWEANRKAANPAKGKGGGSRAATGGGDSEALSTALQGVKQAADAVRALPDNATEEQRADAMKALDAAETKARGIKLPGKNPVWTEANRDKLISGAKGAMPGQRSAPSSGGTAEERKAAVDDAELGLLNNMVKESSRYGAMLGDPNKVMSEAAREEITRRKNIIDQRIAAADARKADINFGRTKGRKEFDTDYETRIEPFRKSLDSFLNEGYLEEESGKRDPRYKIEMKPREKENFLDLVDRIAAKNDRNPDTIVRALLGMAKQVNGPKPSVDPRGIVSYQGVRLNIDGNDLLELARLRGQAVKSSREAISTDFQKKADAETARQGEVLKATSGLEPIPPSMAPQARSMLDRLDEEIANLEKGLANVPERRRPDWESMIADRKKKREVLRARMSAPQAIPAQ
jgi:hypothetical protein